MPNTDPFSFESLEPRLLFSASGFDQSTLDQFVANAESGPAVYVTLSDGSSKVLYANADAWYRGTTEGSGRGSIFKIKEFSGADRVGYVRFDTSGLNSGVSSATLRVDVERTFQSGKKVFLHSTQTNQDGWDERGLDSGNAPSVVTSLGSQDAIEDTTLSFDVTASVQQAITSDDLVSYRFSTDATADIWLTTRESGMPLFDSGFDSGNEPRGDAAAMYGLSLAVYQDPNATTSDGTSLKDRLLERIGILVEGNNEPDAVGRFGWAHNGVMQALTLARHTSAVWNDALTSDQRTRISTLMDAMAIATNWGYDDDNNYVGGLNQEGVARKTFNPNHVEGAMGSLIAASLFHGGGSYLDSQVFGTFDYKDWIDTGGTGKLQAAGFTNIIDSWSPSGEAVMEGVAAGSNSGSNGVGISSSFEYSGRPILSASDPEDDIVDYTGLLVSNAGPDDPFGIYQNLAARMYAHAVSDTVSGYGMVNGSAGSSPFVGQTGMLFELKARDGNGLRTDASYTYDGWLNNIMTGSTLMALGYWGDQADLAELQTIEDRLLVGSKDFLFKMYEGGGWQGRANAINNTDSLAGLQAAGLDYIAAFVDYLDDEINATSGGAAVSLDFESAGQADDSFDVVESINRAQTFNGSGNDYYRLFRTTSSGAGKGALVYNTDNDGTEDTKALYGDVTVSADLRASKFNAQSGIYVRINDARDSALLVSLVYGSNSAIRISDANPSTLSNTLLTSFGKSTGLGQNFETGLGNDDWIRLVAEVRNVGGSAQITVNAYNSQTVFDSSTLLATGTYTAPAGQFTAPGEVGVFAINGSNNNEVNLDNFTIAPADNAPLTFAAGDFYGYGGEDGINGQTSGLSIESGGAAVRLTGNAWKKAALSYNITANTVLEFDLSATDAGEILGIGLDTNDDYTDSPSTVFYLGGSQSIPAQFLDTGQSLYNPSQGQRSYSIAVGQFYIGNINWLTLVGDDDSNGSTNVLFSNIHLYESSAPPPLTFAVGNFSGYSGQDGINGQPSALTIESNGSAIRLTGNAWKKTAFNYNVTADTVLEFDLSAIDTGEVLGIGLDTNDDYTDTSSLFYLGGSQSIPTGFFNAGQSDYTTSQGKRSYLIPIGQFYTGSFNWLTFVADDDANGSTNALFSNIRIYEA